MSIFELHRRWREEYSDFTRSFVQIADERVRAYAEQVLQEESRLWPPPLLQLSPAYALGDTIDQLIQENVLHRDIRNIFCDDDGNPFALYRHQSQAIRHAVNGNSFVITSGTGSGKSFTYLIPILNYLLNHPEEEGHVVAMLFYPMNALVNSQLNALASLKNQYEKRTGKSFPIRFGKYTGETSLQDRQTMHQHPPHLLLTNYMMGELIMVRMDDQKLFKKEAGVRFLVFDELHTYRGRQGADVAMLTRRFKEKYCAERIQHFGASATMVADPDAPASDARRSVAEFASKFFGHLFQENDIIDETLLPVTDGGEPTVDELRAGWSQPLPDTEAVLKRHPLARWMEFHFGLRVDSEGKYRRRSPISVEEGAKRLAEQIDQPEETCIERLKQLLTKTQGNSQPSGRALFAFKLHQFVSQSRPLLATLEPLDIRTFETETHIETEEGKRLAPLYFCRQCGQDYYRVQRLQNEVRGLTFDVQPNDDEESDGDSGQIGYLMIPPDPSNEELPALPDDWYDEAGRLKKDWRKRQPQSVWVTPQGEWSDSQISNGMRMWYQPEPFAFCPSCGVYYSRREREFTKLSGLSNEGRSSAATITAVSLLRNAVQTSARQKLLTFTDNRQDASLQAGHFNHFVQMCVLRAALVNALSENSHLRFDTVGQEVVKASGLQIQDIAREPHLDPDSTMAAEVWKTFTDLTQYRLYEDLHRSWRFAFPNLEQVGLLKIDYLGLDGLCEEDAKWQFHPAFAELAPDQRRMVSRAMLDQFRFNLAIDAKELVKETQDNLARRSAQHLNEYWGYHSEEDTFRRANFMVLFGAAARPKNWAVVSLGDRSAIGRFLQKKMPAIKGDYLTAVRNLLRMLTRQGYLRSDESVADHERFQLNAGCLVWRLGDGMVTENPVYSRRAHRETDAEVTLRANPFFQRFYKERAAELSALEAREHTAQVVAKGERELREKRFRGEEGVGRPLPYLVCSPTMELGVDIADLDLVHMRNIPPTPANYAQRSGRAARQGQPGLILTYCGAYSTHDQYFFARPAEMAAGVVAPPRLDLSNEILLRAHLHAIWLAEIRLPLKRSLEEIVEVAQFPELPLKADVKDNIKMNDSLRRTLEQRFTSVVDTLRPRGSWFNMTWLTRAIDEIPERFDRSLDRWREMLRLVESQLDAAQILLRTARTIEDQNKANRAQQEALYQKNLLLQVDRGYEESDFYPYRYLASEGFLPGYNFPTLPLRVWVPRRQEGEFISRSRVLALREFAPHNVLYHEGSRWDVIRLLSPPGGLEERQQTIKTCRSCGAFNPNEDDCCHACGEQLIAGNSQLLRLLSMPNMAVRRRERITAGEEERLRKGYEISLHFKKSLNPEGSAPHRSADLWRDNVAMALLTYSPATELLYINHGLRQWTARGQNGFRIDFQNGVVISENQEGNSAANQQIERLRLSVQATHNVLFLHLNNPELQVNDRFLRTMQYAMVQGISQVYQLEENEIGSELLGEGDRRCLMLYETSEGGSGTLRQLVEEPSALARVAREMLALCHYDPNSGEDLLPKCQSACYRCLLSFSNQIHAYHINRHEIRHWLIQMRESRSLYRYGGRDWFAHLDNLKEQVDPQSSLERRFLNLLESERLHLPDYAQHRIEDPSCVVDFFYEPNVCVFCDGAPHKEPSQGSRDRAIREQLQAKGYQVLVFHYLQDFLEEMRRYPEVFGVSGARL